VRDRDAKSIDSLLKDEYGAAMTKRARIAAVLSTPIIASLAFAGMAFTAPAAPAGAASPITIGNPIIINIPPIYIQITL
jgi:Flp pilus assembly pilin Flp